MSVKILIADDDAGARNLLLAALEDPRRAFILAKDGKEAIEAWSASSFSLLLLDCATPEFSGVEVLRCVRSAGDPTPAIFLSGDPAVEGWIRAEGFGSVQWLPKPISLTDLRELVVRTLPGASGKTSAP